MPFDVKLDDAELQRALKRLTLKLGKKVTMDAMKSGARVIQKEMKAQVPVRTGKLKKSIKLKQRRTFEGVEVSVGSNLPYAHLVEFAVRPHKVKGRQHPGTTSQPFMRPAFETKVDESVDTIKTKLRDAVTKP